MRLLIMNWLSYLEFYVILTYSISAAEESCYCVKLAECPPLLERHSFDPEDVKYLQSKNCGYVGLEPKVCCPEMPPFSEYCEPDFRDRFESVTRSRLLPDKACGISSERRIFRGKNAKLGSYPWIARLGYTHPNISTYTYRCGGSLINTRFVITAAHCIIDLSLEFKLAIVLLGELDERVNPDCEGEICADPLQDFKPVLAFVHGDFNRPQYRNDIGLIRLDREAVITPWVSPICLPYKKMRKDYTGRYVRTAGWGFVNQTGITPPVLQDVTLKVVDISNCKTAYSTYGISIATSQLCARGTNGENTCKGDSGGPAMLWHQMSLKEAPRYFLLGITSLNYDPCHDSSPPGVFTNVIEYLDWILYNIDGDCRHVLKQKLITF